MSKEIKLEGTKNEVFIHDDKMNDLKILRLVDVDENDVSITLELTSQDVTGKHSLFNDFIDKDVEIIIRTKE